jgi:hypothetical protein
MEIGMEGIEKLIEDFDISEVEMEEIREMMHQKEYRERVFGGGEPYNIVLYDCVLHYVNDEKRRYEDGERRNDFS